MLNQLTHHMNAAFHEAYMAQEKQEVPVGAIVVYNHTIIGRGHNLTRTHCDPTAHAEIVALRQAAQTIKQAYLWNCDVYVTLEPCAMCLGAMVQARIRHIYFGAYDPKGGAVDHGPCLLEHPTIHHKPMVTGGLFERRSCHLLKDFFKSKRL